MPQQQKAVFVTEVGKPVTLGQRNVPHPSENEVLIRVLSTMLLPHDAYGRDWGLFVADNLPYVLGANVAGVVEQVGEAVKGFVVGDHIFGLSNLFSKLPDQQGLQEYATLAADAIAKVPKGVAIDQAVTLPVNLGTSFMALFTSTYGFGFPPPWAPQTEKELLARSSIVIIAAGTVTGKFAIQLAKLVGVGSIIVIAGLSNEAELRSMGATHFISRFGSIGDIARQVRAITGEHGATHVYDCRSMTFELAIAILPEYTTSTLSTLHPIEQPSVLAKERPFCKATFVEGSNENLGEYKSEFWQHAPAWLQSGAILPAPFKTVDGLDKVDEINAALDGYSAATGGPQLIVHPSAKAY